MRGRARGKTLGGLALALFGALLIVLTYIHVISADGLERYYIAVGTMLIGVFWLVSGLHDYMVRRD
ncbi:MAG: hypothetical protein JOZ81_28765 [Chloroflexi bacterium]|nr:hypothetical protein [Chloroflexota bacterium]